MFRSLSLLVAYLALAAVVSGQEFAKHVVVCQEALAADVGRDVMRKGGNAIDASIATAFALAVTHPAAGNLGGGGFLVAYLVDRKEVVTIDFRESAPFAASETMYLDPSGKLVSRHRAGARAAAVPGTVRGLGLAHREFGALPWSELVAPSVELARDGFPVSATLARSLNAQLFRDAPSSGVAEDLGPRADRMADFPESVAVFRKTDGSAWQAGDLLRQPDLAKTLERIARDGPSEFYCGETAARITAYMKSRGGLVTRDDLASYRAVKRPPIRAQYRGFYVYGMSPPASGGVLIAAMLNILERYDLKADGPKSPRTIHRVTEAMRRAFFIRASEIADPDRNSIPVEKLTSMGFADELAAAIVDRATPSASLAPFPISDSKESADTTHLSTIDAKGNAVALTYTLEEGYGSKAVVEGCGFLLNNEMGDFNLIPGRTDRLGRVGTRPNLIAPGKRMLSSQSPTIVVRDGKVRLVTGSPGGRTIPNTTLWVILNVLEFGMTPRAAVDATRTHHQWFPDRLDLEGESWADSLKQDLRKKGHELGLIKVQGDAHTIVVDPETGIRHGVADRRRETSKASGD